MHSEMTPRTVIVIPARYASTRFPGKMLAPLRGKPLVLHAYERALQCACARSVMIATDDQRIYDAASARGARVVMTRADHPCGTDRIAEAVAGEPVDIVVNVQGDEPLIDPATVDKVVRALAESRSAVMSTARRLISEPERIHDPNVVKVVCDFQGYALYFSRSPIPYVRDPGDLTRGPECYWQHIGLYAYRKDFLARYTSMPQTPLEQLEKLEQLRVLENGLKIAVVDTAYRGTGVDVPADLEQVEHILADSEKPPGV